jgi:dipeptidyl aminopeptidase/acylaminoacyl peptidase
MSCRLSRVTIAALLALLPVTVRAQEPARRLVTVDDFLAIKRVSSPQLSPDGRWVAYVVSTSSLKDDKSESRIWMAPLEGGDAIAMTAKGSSASSPRWSPDGKYLAFLAARSGGETQVWLLNRLGGEAEVLTEVKQGVDGFTWSPDATRLALVIQDPTPEQAGDTSWIGHAAKTPPPWVIDRLQFKRDGRGYLDHRRTHLFVFDVATKSNRQITSGDYDDDDPEWSPDGRLIAFVSNRDSVDGSDNDDLWLVASDDTTKGGTVRRLTDNPGSDHGAAWSPDGRWIAYTRNTATEPIGMIYDPEHLAIVSVDGGTPRGPTAALDRPARGPRFAPDGRSIVMLLQDAGTSKLVRVPAAGGAPVPITSGERTVSTFDVGRDGRLVALVSEPELPSEIFAVGADTLRRITHTNDEWLSKVRLAGAEKIRFPSTHGVTAEAFLYRPVGAEVGKRYPTLLRLHGGPVSQYEWGFNFEAQLFAANGYAVVLPNPRGSSGYGSAFSRAIFADWGNEDFDDVMAATDYVVRQGVADPDRLGVGGWSYGGILTDYVITKSTRFKGAISGASEVLYTSNYGHDHYQHLWEIELGLPWRNQKAWDRISPFWSVEKITTPTLIMGGERDWNVPIMNSEQLYQALRRLGRTTELVVYPGQPHGIGKPSYQKDRYERYLKWYDKYVKGTR